MSEYNRIPETTGLGQTAYCACTIRQAIGTADPRDQAGLAKSAHNKGMNQPDCLKPVFLLTYCVPA